MKTDLFRDQISRQFTKNILAVDDGNEPSNEAEEISFSQICSVVNIAHDLKAAVFADLGNKFGNPSSMCERAILAPKTPVAEIPSRKTSKQQNN